MNEIRMVDLRSQYLRHKNEIDTAIQDVLESTAFIRGNAVSEFETELADYMGSEHCIACANGTDALQVAMMSLDLQPGDEVITTPFTFIATIEVICLLKLRPVLVDIDPDTFNIDPSSLEEVLSEKTRAIVPVYLFGQTAEMHTILHVAAKHDLLVIEDNAQAIGATYTFPDGTKKKAGTLGDIGCTSFFPSKNLGAYGDGGALFTDNPTLAEKIRSMVNHGMSKRYHYDHIGVNSRLDTMQAAILRIKLKHLDEYHAARKTLAGKYDAALNGISGIKIPTRAPWSDHIYHQYTIQVDAAIRDELKEYLTQQAIPSMIYYPIPLHVQKAYSILGYKEGDFPVAEAACKTVLSLPMHTEMEEDQADYITMKITNFFN